MSAKPVRNLGQIYLLLYSHHPHYLGNSGGIILNSILNPQIILPYGYQNIHL